jgi:hypothetical protein
MRRGLPRVLSRPSSRDNFHYAMFMGTCVYVKEQSAGRNSRGRVSSGTRRVFDGPFIISGRPSPAASALAFLSCPG